jgi:hypothetical protein
MGTNGILECNISVEKRAPYLLHIPHAASMVARGCWLLEREEYYTTTGPFRELGL